MSDRYSPKYIIMGGIILLVVACILMSFINSLWGLLLVWGILIGGGAVYSAQVPSDKLIITWFSRKSGVAFSAKYTLQSLSGIIVLSGLAWLTVQVGWRQGCIIIGAVIGCVCLPLVWFLTRPKRPEAYGLKPDGDTDSAAVRPHGSVSVQPVSDSYDFTLKEAVRTPTFWLMQVIGNLWGLGWPIIGIHCVPFLTDMGMSQVGAAGMMSLMMTSGIPARIVTGLLVDRVPRNRLRFIIVAGLLMQFAGVGVFLLFRTIPSIYVWFLLTGIGSATFFTAQIPVMPKYFGRRNYGKIVGVNGLIGMPIGIISPVFCGWVYDTTGSYMNFIYMFCGLLAAASIVAIFAAPPKAPAHGESPPAVSVNA
jgi:cyanate permease